MDIKNEFFDLLYLLLVHYLPIDMVHNLSNFLQINEKTSSNYATGKKIVRAMNRDFYSWMKVHTKQVFVFVAIVLFGGSW